MIYLDYAATTPLLPEVREAMANASWANASSTHAMGLQAAAEVAQARATISATIASDPRELLFTSGATEANNLAIQGAARFYQSRGQHLITVSTEHKAVLDTFAALELEGFEVTYLPVNAQGLLDINALQNALRPDTTLVSVMQVNNETGVCQPLADIAEVLSNHPARLHVDAAQGFGKIPLDWPTSSIDYLSVSAHKCYGPKGVGGLFVRRHPRARLLPLQHGGGHEMGLRSGTLSPALCTGFAAACAWQSESAAAEYERLLVLRTDLLVGLQAIGAELNTDASLSSESQSPYILNVRFPNINMESLLLALPNLAVATGSACASASAEPSPVLRAMGLTAKQAEQSLRFSLGWQTNEAHIAEVLQDLRQALLRLKKISGGLGTAC